MARAKYPRRSVDEVIQEARANHWTKLDLSGFGMAQLPEALGQLTQLQWLDVANNRLTALPDWLGQLTRLQELSVANNQLTTLPDWLGQLTRLQWLDVANNQLSSLPEASGQLAQLQQLDVRNNQLTTLPDWLGQLPRLQRLYVQNNQLTTLPDWLGQLPQLQRLSVANNQLTTLPESLGQLPQLQWLYVQNNQLTTLPESLGQLPQLHTLDVVNNQLTTLPESLGQLPQLQEIDASDNQLASLPASIRTISSLRRLFLHGNNALELPPEVLGPTWEQVHEKGKPPADPAEILDYYFRTRGGRRPLNEAKLILVGRGNVGKTSLLKRLLFDTFDPNEKKTEGILIEPWDLLLKGNEKVKLHVWDFGGQEIMHATHQFFLTQRSVYLLVLNGRDGNEAKDADYWLKLIESLGAESPVIVVLNKIKEHPFDLNKRALQQKFPAVREFVRTDCEDRTGIVELRAAIERETDRLEYLRVPFPASWFAIKDRLAGMKENYLAFEQYQVICDQNGETDPQAQQMLAGHLHRLGIALNYSDDPRLRDTHVLNPQWVTSGIYTILNAPKLAEKKGVLRVADLGDILDTQVYPWKMHNFLFDLMKKFELCFHFPDDEGRYLIPELLDVEEPRETAEFRPEACLNFQYHYPILPEGLLPRFIVRTHVLSEGMSRWRTGVILKFEGQRALVKADVPDKKVFISVTGPVAGRRRLLAIIRSDFERIHASIEKLRPDQMVPVPGCPGLVVAYEDLEVMEASGEKTIKKVFEKRVVELDVQALLNGVDLEGTRGRTHENAALQVFLSYSRKDETLRNELETSLKLLQRQGLIGTWYDGDIKAGEDWKTKIDENLERADIILLLVSRDFIASDYCYEKEMPRALERHDAGEARAIPILLRACASQGAPFARLAGLPSDWVPVTKWPDKDSAWQNVEEGIARVVEEMRAARRGGA